MKKGGYCKFWLLCFVLLLLFLITSQVQAQVYPGNYDPVYPFPVTYFYTNPLANADFGYINSITDPFYYKGYGYYPPSSGSGNLLGLSTLTPFLSPYLSYLYNYFGNVTYPYVTSPYTTVFPYNTIPGTIIPYTRFSYPAYTYGSGDFYRSWVLLQ